MLKNFLKIGKSGKITEFCPHFAPGFFVCQKLLLIVNELMSKNGGKVLILKNDIKRFSGIFWGNFILPPFSRPNILITKPNF